MPRRMTCANQSGRKAPPTVNPAKFLGPKAVPTREMHPVVTVNHGIIRVDDDGEEFGIGVEVQVAYHSR